MITQTELASLFIADLTQIENRLVLADALEELGRDAEARLARGPHPVRYHTGNQTLVVTTVDYALARLKRLAKIQKRSTGMIDITQLPCIPVVEGGHVALERFQNFPKSYVIVWRSVENHIRKQWHQPQMQ